MKRRILTSLALAVAVGSGACSDTPTQSVAPELERMESRGGQPAVDVVVVLEDDFAPGGHANNQAAARGIARSLGVTPTHAYGTALFGFAATVPEGRLNALDRDPRVSYWERDRIASIPTPRASAPKWCTPESTHPACSGDDEPEDPPSAQTTPWGVARVGGAADGTGTTAWVIDTGVDLDHPDLVVDVARSVNFANGKDSPNDGNGHGTHVAGTIAAIDNDRDVVGVAAGATIVAVRVLGNSGSGSFSDVIAGVDYVAANASPGDVANMSLTGPGYQPLDDAVVRAADGGVKFALAAGNDGDDAGNYSPARVEHARVFTVSAINDSDCMPSWSNHGNPPVDYAAPGVAILSTRKGGGTTTLSGTSMAAPHVAGILLLGVVVENGSACNDPDGTSDPIAHS